MSMNMYLKSEPISFLLQTATVHGSIIWCQHIHEITMGWVSTTNM